MHLLSFIFPLLGLSSHVQGALQETAQPSPAVASKVQYKKLSSRLSKHSRLLLSSSSEVQNFQDAALGWNFFMQPNFTAVVEAATEGDIVETVRYAVANEIPFLTRATGHGWSGTLEKVQNAIRISTAGMAEIKIDEKNNVATIGPGVTFGHMANTLQKYRKEIPVGSCSCVGMIGPTLGGGHGRLQGIYGLLTDHLLSARVVLASGELIEVSAEKNSDLFWGIRGAGHNFGIVTEATYRIHDQDPKLDGKNYMADFYYRLDQVEEVFKAFNANPLDKGATVYLLLFGNITDYTPIFAVNFAYRGSEEEGKRLAKPYFDLHPYLVQEGMVPWKEVSDRATNGIASNRGFCMRGGRKNSYSTGAKTYDVPTMRYVFDSFAEKLAAHPELVYSAFMFQSYPFQKVREIDAKSTAYANREMNHIIVFSSVYLSPELDDEMNAWGKHLRAKVEKTSGYPHRVVYQNYGRGDEDIRSLYGWEPWRLEKLADLKSKYDPHGRFNGFHPIPTRKELQNQRELEDVKTEL